MFKNILIGTALTLVAASTSFTPAIAQAVPLNYDADPCKTAFENFKQANWEKTHKTDQGNLGGAEGWDELADAADENAATQTKRAEEHRAEARKNPPGPSKNFWNDQADTADREAQEWTDRAIEHRKKAEQMRKDAKDYEQAALKALAECWTLLNIVNALPGYQDITINGKPLKETTETAEPTKTEKKPGKKPVKKAEGGKKKPKAEHIKKQANAGKSRNKANMVAQSIARDVVVNVATGLILDQLVGGRNHRHGRDHGRMGKMPNPGKHKEMRRLKKMKQMGLELF